MERETDINLPVGADHERVWSRNKLEGIKSFIAEQNAKRTPDQKYATELLAVKLQMEDYLENEKVNSRNLYTLDHFLDLHLNAIGLSFKKFAEAIDTTDSNLKKYLTGNRKFNIVLAMKFGSFFHNGPNVWMNVKLKNDMVIQIKNKHSFKKYDYRKVVKESVKPKLKIAEAY